MSVHEPRTPGSTLPPPVVPERPTEEAWPPPADRPDEPLRRSPFALLGLLAGVVGVIGALLPAIDGQRVGDVTSTAFRIGVPLGLAGAVVAVAAGIRTLGRPDVSRRLRAVAGTAIALGVVALLLTAALVFSG